MPPADRTAWERLGRLLAERRSQISPRYANRRAFAVDREMNWRTLHDIEQAKRTNFKPETMRAFEGAYMLAPGSLDRALAGGRLEPLQPAPGPPAPLRRVPDAPPATADSRALEILIGLLDRHPDDERLAAEILEGFLSAYPDDPVIQRVLGDQPGKAPRVVVGEIREWLEFLESRSRPHENGASAGLPEGNAKE